MMGFEDDVDPHASRLRSGRISEVGRTYGVTKCTEARRPLLADPRSAEIVIASLDYLRRGDEIRLLAFVVMPDHWHALFTLRPGGKALSDVMRRIGSFTANQIRKALRLPHEVWQADGYYEHNCRDDEDVVRVAEYIHLNPVRNGLADREEDWPYSSAHSTRRGLLDWEEWLGNIRKM